MLFNSYVFLILFLPVTWCVYFGLGRLRRGWPAQAWLLAASFCFYGYGDWRLCILLLGSICRENLENILPFIEGHEDTEFVIEIPPYSMLYWEQEVLKGELEDTVAIYRYAIETLLSYENVKIYYFQDEEELITNLENYRDPSHHRPEYNRYIFECIRDGRNLLTRENYEGHLTHMYELARDFDYETLWAP